MNLLRRHWLLIVILLVALALRLYRIDATMTFLEDEGRDLLIAKRMIDTGRPVLLGPQTSTGNMYLGPLYYYFITPALYLFGMNPVGPAIMIALSGVLTTYLLFWLGKKWFSVHAGYITALLFAVLPFTVAITRASWNPNLVPLVTVLMLIWYDKLAKAKSSLINWLIYGGLIGVMVQLHYMALVFCGVLSLMIAWSHRTKLLQLGRGILIAVLGTLIIIAPFIIFEVRNNWVNTHALTRFMEVREGSTVRYSLPLWLWWEKVENTSYRLIGRGLTGSESKEVATTKVVVIAYVLLLLSACAIAIKQKQWRYVNLVLILLSSLAVLGIYQDNIHLHYIEFAAPLMLLTLGGMIQPKISHLLHKIAALLIILIVSLSLPRTLGYITSDPTFQTRKAKEVASYIVQKAGNDPYNVVSTQGMYTTPFQYFLAISDHPPSNTLTQRVFDICAGSPCPQDDETTTLLFLTGPAHPAIASYLGHPELNAFDGKRKIVSNEHVSIGIWVAEIVLE